MINALKQRMEELKREIENCNNCYYTYERGLQELVLCKEHKHLKLELKPQNNVLIANQESKNKMIQKLKQKEKILTSHKCSKCKTILIKAYYNNAMGGGFMCCNNKKCWFYRITRRIDWDVNND